jgi:ABC-2 type transport system permease protein
LSDDLVDSFESAGYELRPLSLFNASALPEDCDLLFVTTPQRDWSAETAALVAEYLEGGGRALFFIDYTNTSFINMEGVLSAYGIEFIHGLVVEGNQNNYFQGNPLNLIPLLVPHDISHQVSNRGFPNIIPAAMPIREPDMLRQSVEVTPIMVTSPAAYAKTGDDSQSIHKEPGDIDGPFIISAAVEEYNDVTGVTTKIVVTGAESVLNSIVNDHVMGANYDYIIFSANWTQDAPSRAFISPKTASHAGLIMTAGQAFTLIGMSLLIPIAIIIFGVAVWLRRRNS